jgi:hypothetical protein
MANKQIISVEDTVGRHITPDTEVTIKRTRPLSGNSMVWEMSFDELVDLQHQITTYLAGDRLG